ncbi:hypothetical protein EVAR_50248_1 [Eumeta japonica]|uniref:Uncharacterized protein n=1 Tax=Eumeta variegata TaxID=151549 RepID=A0A4C1YJV9_EUMVA|nr:hypothetical protein EVAR_50248_1 [Eumeta japonica]
MKYKQETQEQLFPNFITHNQSKYETIDERNSPAYFMSSLRMRALKDAVIRITSDDATAIKNKRVAVAAHARRANLRSVSWRRARRGKLGEGKIDAVRAYSPRRNLYRPG